MNEIQIKHEAPNPMTKSQRLNASRSVKDFSPRSHISGPKLDQRNTQVIQPLNSSRKNIFSNKKKKKNVFDLTGLDDQSYPDTESECSNA